MLTSLNQNGNAAGCSSIEWEHMAEKAGSTVSLDANYDAIQNHVNGMSIADAEALSKDEKAVDAVSGATLVDTAGYVGVLVDAAK